MAEPYDANLCAQIKACCKKLKLSSSLVSRAQSLNSTSNMEFLSNVLTAEVSYRESMRIKKLISTAGFPRFYSFDQFHPEEVQFREGCSFESLKSLKFMEEGKNIIMYGGSGTGKTMLSICIGLKLCNSDIPTTFFRTTSLVNQLSENKSDGTLSKFIKRVNKASVLILDEFGYVPYDRIGCQLLFDLLSDLHEQPDKHIILNTNQEFTQWSNILYDEKMAVALIGRLTHHCELIVFPGKNRRLQESSLNNL